MQTACRRLPCALRVRREAGSHPSPLRRPPPRDLETELSGLCRGKWCGDEKGFAVFPAPRRLGAFALNSLPARKAALKPRAPPQTRNAVRGTRNGAAPNFAQRLEKRASGILPEVPLRVSGQSLICGQDAPQHVAHRLGCGAFTPALLPHRPSPSGAEQKGPARGRPARWQAEDYLPIKCSRTIWSSAA
jgi:hypothetical protein